MFLNVLTATLLPARSRGERIAELGSAMTRKVSFPAWYPPSMNRKSPVFWNWASSRLTLLVNVMSSSPVTSCGTAAAPPWIVTSSTVSPSAAK